MKFKEFKAEIVSRCKSKGACTNEFKRVSESKSFKELIPVLTDNFTWSCRNSIIDVELLEQVGNEILNKYDLAFNKSVSKGYLLSNNATVKASNNATVEAWGNATVEAWGNATVEALGNAYINSFNSIEHKLSYNAICRYYNENRIIVSEDAKIETY